MPRPDSWDWAFAAVDRVERVDPRAGGRGPVAEPAQPDTGGGRREARSGPPPSPARALRLLDRRSGSAGTTDRRAARLHLDDRATAQRLVRESSPRGSPPLLGTTPTGPARRRRRRGSNGQGCSLGGPAPAGQRVGPARDRPGYAAGISGSPGVTGRPRPRATNRSTPAARSPRSAGAGPREGRPAPAASSPSGRDGSGNRRRSPDCPRPPSSVLADDPPLVWWGWSDPDGEHDLIRWSGLRQRVREFLEALPSPPGPKP